MYKNYFYYLFLHSWFLKNPISYDKLWTKDINYSSVSKEDSCFCIPVLHQLYAQAQRTWMKNWRVKAKWVKNVLAVAFYSQHEYRFSWIKSFEEEKGKALYWYILQ